MTLCHDIFKMFPILPSSFLDPFCLTATLYILPAFTLVLCFVFNSSQFSWKADHVTGRLNGREGMPGTEALALVSQSPCWAGDWPIILHRHYISHSALLGLINPCWALSRNNSSSFLVQNYFEDIRLQMDRNHLAEISLYFVAWIGKACEDLSFFIVVGQSLTHVQLFATPWTAARQASLSFTTSWSLLKLMSIESVMPSTISSSAAPSPPAFSFSQHQGLFPMSRLFISGGQSIGISTSASVLPMNIQSSFPLGLTGLILQSKGFSKVFSNTTVQKHQFAAFFIIQLSHPYMTTGKKP